MSKLNNLNVAAILSHFSNAIPSESLNRITSDIKAELGRLEKDIVSKGSDWKVGTKGRIQSKEGHTLQLPLNAGWTVLLRFGMQIHEISNNGSNDAPKYHMDIQADVPFEAQAWVNKRIAAGKPEVAEAA